MLTFVGVAEKKGVRFLSYSSTAEGLLEWAGDSYRFTRVIVRPSIVVDEPGAVAAVRQALERAHATCLIARSIQSPVDIEPTISLSDHSEL